MTNCRNPYYGLKWHPIEFRTLSKSCDEFALILLDCWIANRNLCLISTAAKTFRSNSCKLLFWCKFQMYARSWKQRWTSLIAGAADAQNVNFGWIIEEAKNRLSRRVFLEGSSIEKIEYAQYAQLKEFKIFWFHLIRTDKNAFEKELIERWT